MEIKIEITKKDGSVEIIGGKDDKVKRDETKKRFQS